MPRCDLKEPREHLPHRGTIGTVPDEVLLDIFDFYREDRLEDRMDPQDFNWRWHKLLHMCRKWRDIVFTSPRHLDLRLLCTVRTPHYPPHPADVDSIFVALDNPDRLAPRKSFKGNAGTVS
ncbi:hypothetical protein V8E53_013525 [Lactarius tabidus]